VATVHQVLTKPTTPEQLKEVLTRACALQDLLADADLKALISRLGSLPSLPALYAELQRRLQDPDCALNDVARIIEQDLGMCAKVLQLVNSSFFGLPRTIDSPARAVSLLGLDLVRALVLSAGVFTELRPVGRQALRVEELQAHSLDVARCARLIATAESGHKEVADNACIAGMVHDAGKLLLAASLPGEYAEVLGQAREQGQACWQAERQVLAADHGLVGGYLLGLWGLPGPVVEAVTLHHRLEDDPEPSFSPALAVHAADALCHQLRPGTDGLPRPELNTALLERAGLLDRVDQWLALCAGAEA
jgi:HD-like signal output (HDOD) protein